MSSLTEIPGPGSSVLVDVLDPTTAFQQVYGWRGDHDCDIGALGEDSHAVGAKQIGRVPSPVPEGQPFAVMLVVYNQGEPLELARASVQVESKYPERPIERDRSGGLTGE